MLKLFPYIKRYYLMILGAILLLFLQANVELTLPDYLSRIVNIGIQQGGVDTSLPEAMRVSTYERTQLFLSPEENEMVANAYQLLDPTDPKYTDTHDRCEKHHTDDHHRDHLYLGDIVGGAGDE